MTSLRLGEYIWKWEAIPFVRIAGQHTVVNIARFILDVIEDEGVVMSMRIIAGKPYRDTPVFSSHINYLVLNPSWNVPVRIAIGDKLPMSRQDPTYLAQNHMKLLRG